MRRQPDRAGFAVPDNETAGGTTVKFFLTQVQVYLAHKKTPTPLGPPVES